MVSNKNFSSAGTGSETNSPPWGPSSSSLAQGIYSWSCPPAAVPGQDKPLVSRRWLLDVSPPWMSANGVFPLPESSNHCGMTHSPSASCSAWQSGSVPPPTAGHGAPAASQNLQGGRDCLSAAPQRARAPSTAGLNFCSLTLEEGHVLHPSLCIWPLHTLLQERSSASQTSMEYSPRAPLETQDIYLSLFNSMSYLEIGCILFLWHFVQINAAMINQLIVGTMLHQREYGRIIWNGALALLAGPRDSFILHFLTRAVGHAVKSPLWTFSKWENLEKLWGWSTEGQPGKRASTTQPAKKADGLWGNTQLLKTSLQFLLISSHFYHYW